MSKQTSGWLVLALVAVAAYIWIGPPSCRQGGGSSDDVVATSAGLTNSNGREEPSGRVTTIVVGSKRVQSVNLADTNGDFDQLWSMHADKVVVVSGPVKLKGSFGQVHKIPEPLLGGNNVQVSYEGNTATATWPEPGRYWVEDTRYDVMNNGGWKWAVLIQYE